MQKILCNVDDSLDRLKLPIRVSNALQRADIFTIGQLQDAQDKDKLWQVRNLGEKGIAAIEAAVSKILLSPKLSSPIAANIGHDLASIIEAQTSVPKIQVQTVLEGLKQILRKQIVAGLLHEDVRFNTLRISDFLKNTSDSLSTIYEYLPLLTCSVSIAGEIEMLSSGLPARELNILQLRYGYQTQTLQSVAAAYSLSRERIRQLEKQAAARLQQTMQSMQMIRIPSAILFADDLNLSFNQWAQRLLKTGLLGDWTLEQYRAYDPLELMVTICRMTKNFEHKLEFPPSLEYMLQLRKEGRASVTAKALFLQEAVSKEELRFIRQHAHYSGAVSLDWLKENQILLRFTEKEMIEFLEGQGFSEIAAGWYFSPEYRPDRRHNNHVLHNSLVKMFQYCGPLQIRDVSFGVEHALVKRDFPVPPTDVLEAVLVKTGYKLEDNKWSWDGEANEGLNSGEKVIWQTIKNQGGVAHHSELTQAVLRSELSFPVLHATLRNSPLFDNFEWSLYKIRGAQPNREMV